MNRHSGVYPYYCPYCTKGLNGTKDTKEHIRAHHTGLHGYHCATCKQEFQHVKNLKAHLDEKCCHAYASQ